MCCRIELVKELLHLVLVSANLPAHLLGDLVPQGVSFEVAVFWKLPMSYTAWVDVSVLAALGTLKRDEVVRVARVISV